MHNNTFKDMNLFDSTPEASEPTELKRENDVKISFSSSLGKRKFEPKKLNSFSLKNCKKKNQ